MQKHNNDWEVPEIIVNDEASRRESANSVASLVSCKSVFSNASDMITSEIVIETGTSELRWGARFTVSD